MLDSERPFPTVAEVGGRMTILYPGDAAYERAAAGAPVVGDPPGPRNRSVMDGGRWRGERRDAP